MQMKRILGILLAVCFLMSVTAAAVSASGENARGSHVIGFEEHGKKNERNDKDFKFFEHAKQKHHHPGHFEKQRVGHREFRNNKYVVVYVIKTVWLPAYDDWN